MTSQVTTHVLDASTGTPAAGIEVVLRAAGTGGVIDRGTTDADGRLALGPDSLDPDEYDLVFVTQPYFTSRAVEAFYPRVTLTFTIPSGPHRHYHVPLLLSPFAYSTYRGS
ncbi:hydroxyisourate hydrolase [uncultured Aeromicrobium sp.]|uniref:hydroxyisourate hydrolase n=1 Tax=uncultured Aeromicrobium sp. TaxID=337820 RepID=UPI0025DA6531|nr:hydroxyisourate hydrolase [uncultured Aeromicrobium sp.]